MSRKTIDVATVVKLANRALENSENSYQQGRLGIAGLLEAILHETGNYNGFNYLPTEFAKPGEPTMTLSNLHRGYDDSRRYYYPPKDK